MDIFKSIVCLIIAVIIYFIVGLIAWNIVCSMGHRTKRILRIERKEYQTY